MGEGKKNGCRRSYTIPWSPKGVTGLLKASLEPVDIDVAKLVDRGRWVDRLVRWLRGGWIDRLIRRLRGSCRFVDLRVPVVGCHATSCQCGIRVNIAAVLRFFNIEVAIGRLPRRGNGVVLVGPDGFGGGSLVRVERRVGDFIRVWLVALLVPVQQRESWMSARRSGNNARTAVSMASPRRGQNRGNYRSTEAPSRAMIARFWRGLHTHAGLSKVWTAR